MIKLTIEIDSVLPHVIVEDLNKKQFDNAFLDYFDILTFVYLSYSL